MRRFCVNWQHTRCDLFHPARISTGFRVKGWLRARRLSVALPALYVLLGLAAIPAPRHEVFPFFCWFLFPVTPNLVTRYQLELMVANGEALLEPTPIQSAEISGKHRNSMDLQMAVQAFGDALVQRHLKRAELLRRRIEANFLPAPCAYRVRQVQYDPLERWYGSTQASDGWSVDFVCGAQ